MNWCLILNGGDYYCLPCFLWSIYINKIIKNVTKRDKVYIKNFLQRGNKGDLIMTYKDFRKESSLRVNNIYGD